MSRIIIDPDIVKMFETDVSLEKIKDQVVRTSIVAWNSIVSRVDIEEWLSNFDGSACGDKEFEQKIACWILLYFTYFTEDDIGDLCKALYRNFIRQEIQKFTGSTKAKSLEYKIDYILKNTIFLPLGNASESAGRILYSFRTRNDLPRFCFEIGRNHYRNVVLIDDLTITGEQASRYVGAGKLPVTYDSLYFATFFATQNAVDNISKVKEIEFLNVCVLDDRTRAFSDSSFVFSHEKMSRVRDVARLICKHYGLIVVNGFTSKDLLYMKNHPLGFGDSQQLIGFSYNTPDNVLPILWGKTGNWVDIFRRFPKKNYVEGVDELSEQYI